MGEGVNILMFWNDLLRLWPDTRRKKLQYIVRDDADTFEVSFDLADKLCCRINIVTEMVGDEVRTAERHRLGRLTMRSAA